MTKRFIILFVFHFSFLTSFAQGLPLIRNYTKTEYGAGNYNFDIEVGHDGTVYVANFKGLLYYDRAQWRMLYTADSSRVTSVYRDSNDTIWVGGYNYAAYLKKRANGELCLQEVDQKGQNEGPQKDYYDAAINAIIQTIEIDGGLKVNVQKNSGLVIVDSNDQPLYAITEANGLCSNQVTSVAYDGHGLLWGATTHGVFAIELPSVYSYLLPEDGLAGEVHAMMAFEGKIYVGTSNGLYVVSNRQCQRVAEINDNCWSLCESRDGLLVATISGVYQIASGGNIKRLTSNPTTGLLVDGDKVYAGENDGVWLYQAGNRTKVNDRSLAMYIRKDAQGKLWFPSQVEILDGNPSDSIWLKPLSNIEIKAQYRYDNQLWLGGDEILAIVDTSQKDFAKLFENCNVHFRSIILGNDSVLWGGYGDMPKVLPKLDSDERHLRFVYALDYAPLTGKTLYRYRLNNDRWSAWSDKQDVELLMTYGSFTLSVQAQLPDGELSEVASVDFCIAYPLLMRWYMVVLYLIGFAFLVYLLFRYRLKRLQKEKVKLEQIVEERTADLRNAQQELIRQEKMASVGKLTEGLIDRILNPMNYIINFSKMSIDLLKDLKGNFDNNKDRMDQADYDDSEDLFGMLTENLENVDNYGQNTSHILKAMEEMLKDRTSGYAEMDLLPILQQNGQMLTNNYANEIAQYGIQTIFTLPGDRMPIYGNPEMLSKVIMSLLDNAVYALVKKAQKQSDLFPPSTFHLPQVSLTATASEGKYTLKIRDNGVGIEENNLTKIFDPFFTTKTTSEAAGIGLYLSREIIQNHGGDIRVSSVKDEYTEFTITLADKQ